MDMLFITYAAFFYFYGVYLHSGHELESLSAHNAYFNTSFQVPFLKLIFTAFLFTM